MPVLVDLATAFVAGLLAGAVYFAGLWLTVRRLTSAGLAPLWLFISAAVRLALLVGALYWIMDDRLEKLLAALAGVLLARVVSTWSARTRISPRKHVPGP